MLRILSLDHEKSAGLFHRLATTLQNLAATRIIPIVQN